MPFGIGLARTLVFLRSLVSMLTRISVHPKSLHLGVRLVLEQFKIDGAIMVTTNVVFV